MTRKHRLLVAELFAADLVSDTDQQIQLLHQIHEELQLKHAVNQGAVSAVREEFAETYRSTEALLKRLHAQRDLLTDLRATLVELRRNTRSR